MSDLEKYLLKDAIEKLRMAYSALKNVDYHLDAQANRPPEVIGTASAHVDWALSKLEQMREKK